MKITDTKITKSNVESIKTTMNTTNKNLVGKNFVTVHDSKNNLVSFALYSKPRR